MENADRRLLIATGLVHGALLLLAGVPSLAPALWGTNAWTFASFPALGAALALAAAASFLLPRIPFPRRGIGFAAMFLIALPCLFLFRDRSHLLGDGGLWITAAAGPGVYHAHEPLAFALPWFFTGGGRLEGDPTLRLELWSVFLGAATLVLLARIAARLGTDASSRWFVFLLAVAGAALQFACGYIEAYPTLWAAVVLYLALGLAVEEGRIHPAWAGLAWGVAAAVHGLGAGLAIPTLYLLRRRGGRTWGAALLLAALPVSAAYGVLPRLMSAAGGGTAGTEEALEATRSLLGGLRFYSHGWGAWLLDQVNRWALIAPLAWGLVAGGFLIPANRRRGRVRFLLWASLALVLPSLVVDTEGSRGASVDWDLFAVAGTPLSLLAATLWAARLRGDPRLHRALSFGLTVALFGTGAFLAVNASPSRAAMRLESLVASPQWSAEARGLAYESLATMHRRLGETGRAADAYLQATRFQTGNPRLLQNAGTLLSLEGRHRDAAAVYRRLADLEKGRRAITWFRLGTEAAEAGEIPAARDAIRRALEVQPGWIDAMNVLGQLLLSAPSTAGDRAEARRLLEGSLARRPDQPHAADIRDTLRRLDQDAGGGG